MTRRRSTLRERYRQHATRRRLNSGRACDSSIAKAESAMAEKPSARLYPYGVLREVAVECGDLHHGSLAPASAKRSAALRVSSVHWRQKIQDRGSPGGARRRNPPDERSSVGIANCLQQGAGLCGLCHGKQRTRTPQVRSCAAKRYPELIDLSRGTPPPPRFRPNRILPLPLRPPVPEVLQRRTVSLAIFPLRQAH
jgi:hypothetical protein